MDGEYIYEALTILVFILLTFLVLPLWARAKAKKRKKADRNSQETE